MVQSSILVRRRPDAEQGLDGLCRSRAMTLRSLTAAVMLALAAVGSAPAAIAQPVAAARSPALVPLEQAFMKAATDLFAKLPASAGETTIVIDPLIDGVTGIQSAATRGFDRRIAELVAQRYPHVKVLAFTPENVAKARFVFIGTFNTINNAGQPGAEKDAFWICFALVEREAKTVYARSVSRSVVNNVDIAPAASYSDSPVWGMDAATRAYIEACQKSQPGTPVAPAYIDQLGAAARIREASAAYEAGDHSRARDLYREVKEQPGGDQLRVLNGLYLSYAALGETGEADQTFGEMVERGFSLGQLGVKFLFEPNSTAFNADRKLSASYPAWLREIAARATKAGICLEVVGHASRTGPEALNDRLSRDRAERIASLMAGQAPGMSQRLRASGVGYREALVGLPRDDASTAVDRRVEFKTAPCA